MMQTGTGFQQCIWNNLVTKVFMKNKDLSFWSFQVLQAEVDVAQLLQAPQWDEKESPGGTASLPGLSRDHECVESSLQIRMYNAMAFVVSQGAAQVPSTLLLGPCCWFAEEEIKRESAEVSEVLPYQEERYSHEVLCVVPKTKFLGPSSRNVSLVPWVYPKEKNLQHTVIKENIPLIDSRTQAPSKFKP
ncbi:hypothetical protein AV530_005346 [Patagioenas fasciata monilis]|uniref:Uncharacterized protein n=1 Tax=Patagioenas fasciata monilis TaxID=372326 RepID=A0A1V4JKY6_PATFA|nr:hypothetical protein AV530_005346 [Patagioenas fasciata monilis]